MTLHYLTSRYITQHCIALHYITLQYITLHCTTLHSFTYCITLYYVTLHYTTLYYITAHYITLHYITSHYITLQYITLHYTTLHYIALHYMTLNYITLHCILITYMTYTQNTHYLQYIHCTDCIRNVLAIFEAPTADKGGVIAPLTVIHVPASRYKGSSRSPVVRISIGLKVCCRGVNWPAVNISGSPTILGSDGSSLSGGFPAGRIEAESTCRGGCLAIGRHTAIIGQTDDKQVIRGPKQ